MEDIAVFYQSTRVQRVFLENLWTPRAFCVPHTSVLFCKTYSEVSNDCVECSFGFHLVGNKCVKDFIGAVENCLSYGENTACLECFNNFHLNA
jgi:hypothetical protein